MKPKLLEGKWYIEVQTDEFRNVLLFNDVGDRMQPAAFDTKQEAEQDIARRLQYNNKEEE